LIAFGGLRPRPCPLSSGAEKEGGCAASGVLPLSLSASGQCKCLSLSVQIRRPAEPPVLFSNNGGGCAAEAAACL